MIKAGVGSITFSFRALRTIKGSMQLLVPGKTHIGLLYRIFHPLRPISAKVCFTLARRDVFSAKAISKYP